MEQNETVEAALAEIAALKSFLAETDYQALKHSDGALSDEEYAETKAKRQLWRDKINQYEAQIAQELAAYDEEDTEG